jgi:hypothetical protein
MTYLQSAKGLAMKLTNRGWYVLGILTGLGIVALFYITNHLWWVGDGEGYCWGELSECYWGEK